MLLLLQAAQAVKAELKKAETAHQFARILFIAEDLVYVDAMKGTGWGRKRSWCKDQLETCQTLAQVSFSCLFLVVKRLRLELQWIPDCNVIKSWLCYAPAHMSRSYVNLPEN